MRARELLLYATLPLAAMLYRTPDEVLDASALHAATDGKVIAGYRAAHPYPHVAIDDLFPRGFIQAVANEIPETHDSGNRVKHARFWPEFLKSQISDERRMKNQTRLLINTMRSKRFLKIVEGLSGISGLTPDPKMKGSGIHLTARGGQLQMHTDWNHLSGDVRWHRRVNIFFYLNDDWPDEYEGHLELWDRNLSRCGKRLLPTMGRFVAFTSTDFSQHGHPVKLNAPAHRMRKSIAMYFYTYGTRPAEDCFNGDCTNKHTAIFKPTPLEISANCPIDRAAVDASTR